MWGYDAFIAYVSRSYLYNIDVVGYHPSKRMDDVCSNSVQLLLLCICDEI